MGESPLGNRAGRLHLACVKMFLFSGGGKEPGWFEEEGIRLEEVLCGTMWCSVQT